MIRALSAVFLLAQLATTTANSAGITVSDDRGKRVALLAPAQRIIALAPSITELVYAAGAGGRLVGVARFSDYPAAAKDIQHIGDASRIDLERVLSLKPDLIIGWISGNQAADIERLEQLLSPPLPQEARLHDFVTSKGFLEKRYPLHDLVRNL